MSSPQSIGTTHEAIVLCIHLDFVRGPKLSKTNHVTVQRLLLTLID